MSPTPSPRLTHLAALWQRAYGPWRGRVFFAALITATVAGAHLARAGTAPTRLATGAILIAITIAWWATAWWVRRADADPARLAKKISRLHDQALGGKAERAVRLVGASDASGDPLAAGLARVHLERLLSHVRPEDIWDAGKRRDSLWSKVLLVLIAAALCAFAVGPLRVLEGLDVLVAYKGRAPLSLDWVDTIFCEAQPPSYLGSQTQMFIGFVQTHQPRGTTLRVHARAKHDGRQLVLTDGQREVPFAEDGRGGIVATWEVERDADLQIAVRFGEVLIPQRDELSVLALEDEVPQVKVEGAPRTVRLLDLKEVPIRYEVADDHGLTEVDLVLRAGGKESRRVLAKHDGTVPFDQGSAVLQRNDRFLRGAHVPVEVTIEARDNDPIGGPKWGRSKPVVLLPPAVGEAEAMRFEALRGLRDVVVDLLAARLTMGLPDGEVARVRLIAEQRDAHEAFADKVREVATARYGGLEVSRRLGTLYTGQLERMNKALKATCPRGSTKDACAKSVERLRTVTGDAALAWDLVGRSLSTRDSVRVARRLADVAEEGAEGARLIRQPESDRGRMRLKAALTVLAGGSESLKRLGGLGGDLGDVVYIGSRRIERCMTRDDTECAERAATDLAARLRRPYPSFSGGGGRRGTEAGGTPGLDDSSAGAEAMEAFESHGDDIEEVAKEHAERIDEVRKTMSEAMNAVDMESLGDAAREHARYVREAVRGLPTRAADMSSVEGAAMVMREQAERMADALDRGALSDADRAADNAMKAADQAQRVADRERDLFGQPSSLGRDVERARGDLEREQRWVREQLDRMRRAASDRARDQLKNASRSERELAERAKEIAKRARNGENPLPQGTMEMLEEASKAMREAARALDQADGEQAMSRQRQAQRLLEMAGEALNESGSPKDSSTQDHPKMDKDAEGDSEKQDGEGEGKNPATGPVDIPGADAFKGPEAFRRRVVEGLSEPADPALREAVRRYTEGLLR